MEHRQGVAASRAIKVCHIRVKQTATHTHTHTQMRVDSAM